MTNDFKTYLNTYLEEKGIDQDEEMTLNDGAITHFMTVRNVVEFMVGLNNDDQEAIKKKLVQIDFLNGDVRHFLKFIARGMIKFY